MEAFIPAAASSLVLWAASFLYFRSYLKNRTRPERILSDLRDEVDKLIAEIDATTDRDVQLVEDRIKALRALLDDADKRIGVLRREAERRGAEERAYAEFGRRQRPYGDVAATAPAMPPVPPPVAPPAASTEAGPQPVKARGTDSAPTLFSEPTTAVPRFARAAEQIPPKEPPFAERVGELHRAGFSSELIAARLGKTVGEVDLAIALSLRTGERDGDDARY